MFRGNRQCAFRTVEPVPAPSALPPTLAQCWADLPHTESGFTTVDYRHETAPDETAFALWLEEDAVCFLVRAGIASTGSVRTLAPGPDADPVYADSFEIMLDPLHNHMDYLWVQWAAGGVRRAAVRQVCEFALRCDFTEQDSPVPDDAWTVREERTPDAWYSLVRLPFDMPGMAGASRAATWGLNVVQRRWIGRRLYEPAWNLPAWRTHAPWDFGEVRLLPSSIAVRSLDFGEVYHDWNALRLEVESRADKPVALRARVRASSPTHTSHGEAQWILPPRGTHRAELRFELDAREWRRQDIELRIEEDGRTTYEARFAAGHTPRHGGACLVLKHGVRIFDGDPPRNPEPGTPGFTAAKRRYVLYRLPDFPEPGWWGGPRQDCVLRDRRSPLAIDLRRDDAFDRLGDAVAERFETDEDRVVAATMLVHRIMIYSPVGRRFAMFLSPLGSLRQAATICSGFACVAHGLFAGLPRVDGERGFASLYTAAHHHTIITVELPGYSTMVDPTLGAFHYTRDHQRLASIDELVADPDIAGESILGRREDYAGCLGRSLAWFPSLPYPPRTPDGAPEMRP